MKEIVVYADWIGMAEPLIMGILRVEQTRGEEIFSFEYETNWLKSEYVQELDPDLRLYRGPQYLDDNKPNFGLFLDSSPDRWGRMLMERREIIAAREANIKRKRLLGSDFLLGVQDVTRMGALRFKLDVDKEFLADDEQGTIPPITSIRQLEQASLLLEEDDFFQNPNAQTTLNLLLNPGSSLGGARPKANVQEMNGDLWIAKFPSKNDNKNSGAWEYLTNQMALDLGINMAQASARVYSQKQHTFLTKRFDRVSGNKRIHFASAMTLLGYKDGHNYQEGGSYLELVELIERFGAEPDEDIRELWMRVVFSVAVTNIDDHLRNHGFLLTPKGWKLSPAYDINPSEYGSGLSLNISEGDNSLDFDLCIEVSGYFRWEMDDAVAFIHKTKQVLKTWRDRANKLNIPSTEQTMMESAFKTS